MSWSMSGNPSPPSETKFVSLFLVNENTPWCKNIGNDRQLWHYITGFQFMANKQFRMEKKIGNISVRWYLTICSQKPISSIFIWINRSTHLFWIIFLFFCRFLYQIRLQKTVFLTKMEWNVLFNPIYKNFFLTSCAFCHIKNQ